MAHIRATFLLGVTVYSDCYLCLYQERIVCLVMYTVLDNGFVKLEFHSMTSYTDSKTSIEPFQTPSPPVCLLFVSYSAIPLFHCHRPLPKPLSHLSHCKSLSIVLISSRYALILTVPAYTVSSMRLISRGYQPLREIEDIINKHSSRLVAIWLPSGWLY